MSISLLSFPADAAETRTYYIAADEIAWDYAPSGINLITGLPFEDEANVFVLSDL